MANLDPRFDPLALARAGVIPNVDWRQQLAQGAAPVQGVQDVAGANAAAQAQAMQSAAAAAAAAAGGIQNQKDDELASAVLALNGQSPRQAALQRQVKMADAMRARGSALNTGSVGGAAPNWAGALANLVGAYKGRQLDEQADASAGALADEQANAARKYFNALRAARS
jgi:hypothetical protein